MQTKENKVDDTGGQHHPYCCPSSWLCSTAVPHSSDEASPLPFASLPVLSLEVASGFLMLNPADPFHILLGFCSMTGLITPSFLNCTSLELLQLVLFLPLWLLPVSCAGFSTHPMHHGVSQDSVMGFLEEPIHADGFDSLPRN